MSWLLRIIINAYKIFLWDIRINGQAHFWRHPGLSLSELFNYSLALCIIRQKESEGKNLLDAGSGYSCFPSFTSRFFSNATAFDVNRKCLVFQNKIKSKFKLTNFNSAEPIQPTDRHTIRAALPFEDCSFDITTSISVIEHIEDDLFALKELRRVTKPDGKIILVIPYAPAGRKTNYGENAYFQRFYTRDQLLNLFEKADIQVITSIPYTVFIKPLFEKFVYHYWPKRYVPIINIALLFPLSLIDMLFLKSGQFHTKRFLNIYDTPGHYLIVLKRRQNYK